MRFGSFAAVESIHGYGELFGQSSWLGHVTYALTVWHEILNAEQGREPDSWDYVEGALLYTGGIDLSKLADSRAPLKLRLQDGRMLDCSLTDSTGAVASHGPLGPKLTN